MIKLTKAPEPPVLANNAAKWTAELLAEIGRGGDGRDAKLNRYRHPQIKESLKSETHRKCAYCESKILHVSPGDIEHIVPKAVDPSLAFEWKNLTLACSVCNIGKSDKEGFIDPYNVDPEDQFEFLGPMICHKIGESSAEWTKNELNLNRMDLIDRRRDRIDGLIDKLERIHATRDNSARTMLIDRLARHETDIGSEYAACTRAWIATRKALGTL